MCDAQAAIEYGPVEAPATPDELLEAARLYATDHPISVDLARVEWEITRRAKKRSGVCIYHPSTESITIRLSWDAYEEFGWQEFKRIICHELIHAWEFQTDGSAGHGPRFREQAEAFDVPTYCDQFTDPRLRLECVECSWSTVRYRASKVVQHPRMYRCGECGGEITVTHVDTNETWAANDEYRRARNRIGDDW